MKTHQVGYKDKDGKVKYCHLSSKEGTEYLSLKSDADRTKYVKRKLQIIEIKRGFLP